MSDSDTFGDSSRSVRWLLEKSGLIGGHFLLENNLLKVERLGIMNEFRAFWFCMSRLGALGF